jgi:hypothetical protein
LKSLCGAYSLLRLHLKHLLDEYLGLVGDVLPLDALEGDVAEGDVLKDLLIVLPVERRVTREQDVQDHTASPHITFLVILLLEDLGGDVEGGAHAGVHILVRFEGTGEPEVNYFDLVGVRLYYQ